MKRGWKIALFSVLLLSAVGGLTWYFIMRRTVPSHARCIPKDAIAVLTLNVRELALDRASGGHLFPELANQPTQKELKPFLDAIAKNGGSGLNEMADVLVFFYHNNEAAFFGLSVSVKDSAVFGKLIRAQVSKQIPLNPFSLQGTSIVRFDTSSAVLGWNKDMALLIYPFSNHDAHTSAEQCARLLSQSEEASVLSDENFRTHELSPFDAGLWLQAKPLLAFTGGGSYLRATLSDVDYLSLNINFRNGETDIRRFITTNGKSGSTPYNDALLMSSDPKQVQGFWRIPLDFKNDSLLDTYLHFPPVNMLPFGEDRIKSLYSTFDGNCSLLLHDTLSYDMQYLTEGYDENFNRVQQSGFKKVTVKGLSACFGLSDEHKAKELISGWMRSDSVPFTENTWVMNDRGEKTFITVTDKILTVTNWPQSDGKKRTVPGNWQNLDLFFPLDKYYSPSENSLLSFWFAGYDKELQLLSDNFGTLTISQPLVQDHLRTSEIRITMHNTKVNALVQMEELAEKILEDKH